VTTCSSNGRRRSSGLIASSSAAVTIRPPSTGASVRGGSHAPAKLVDRFYSDITILAAVLADELHQARRRAGRTQVDLSRASGVAQGDISKIERGLAGATITTVDRLATALSCEVTLAPALTREDRVTLALHLQIADHLVADPERVLGLARSRIGRWRREQAAHSQPWVAAWGGILELPARVIAELIVERGEFARELRQNSPFIGVLSEAERRAAIQEARSL
jgi:transcriptional regulator with XRE-family HTH domain